MPHIWLALASPLDAHLLRDNTTSVLPFITKLLRYPLKCFIIIGANMCRTFLELILPIQLNKKFKNAFSILYFSMAFLQVLALMTRIN